MVGKYGTRFCQFYAEDMLQQFPSTTYQEQQELIEAHQHFRFLFQGWLLEEGLWAERDLSNQEPKELDLYQLQDASWVEYTPIHELPEDAIIQIVSRLDWIDRTIMTSLHPVFLCSTKLRKFGEAYVAKWGE